MHQISFQVMPDALSALHEQILKKYQFNWEILDILVSGKSLIDSNEGLTGFPMRSLEDADRFMRSYGYDLNDPIEKAEMLGHLQEAVNFIRKYFLQPENPEGLKLEIPRRFFEITDVRDLLLMASMNFPGQSSDTKGVLLKKWACCFLKVIHTLTHMDRDLRTSYFVDIQKQIFDRFYKFIHRSAEGKLYLGENADDFFKVDLVAFETKPKKSRDSILIKLLHKSENVAEDIFDRVGMRFVTLSKMDSVRVLKYLKDMMIVMPANLKPSRSRNTLVDLESFQKQCQELTGLLKENKIGADDFEKRLENGMTSMKLNGVDNPHTSEFYRAIQFTGRQLIKLKNPIYEDIKELKNITKTKGNDVDTARVVERIDLKYIQREIRFYYPFEVQILDQKSATENEAGRSAHSEYKKAQVQTAMKRVMGSLMDVAR